MEFIIIYYVSASVIHCSFYSVSNNNQHIFVSGTNEKYKTIQKYCCQNTAKEKSKIATFTLRFCRSSQVKVHNVGFSMQCSFLLSRQKLYQ